MATYFQCGRLSVLPTPLRIIFKWQVRFASTAQGPSSEVLKYPYPTNSRPTPYQIFHLPPGSSQKDIKARYYDLVRYHHPDSVHGRFLSPSERHARFQAITSAYDVLRGRGSSHSPTGPYAAEVQRRKRAYNAHHNRRAEYAQAGRAEWAASADDRWKDRVILIIGMVTLVVGIAPGLFLLPFRMEMQHRSAVLNLSQARTEARELGEERRDELRKRVQDIKMQTDRGDRPESES